MKSTRTILIFLAVFVLYCLIVMPLLPFSDDWNYRTAPNCFFTVSGLLPTQVSWRPLDALFGAFLGLEPSLFPFANRVAVIFGHVLGGYFTYRILRDFLSLNKQYAALATGYFLFAAGTFATLASVDSMNQVYSSTFGILAFYCYYIFKKRGGLAWYIYSVVMCTLAVFAKENGIVWFVVIPFLYSYEWLTSLEKNALISNREKIADTAKYFTFGLLCCVAYFAVRFALAGTAKLGASEGTYEMTVSLDTIKKGVTLTAGAFTFIDSVALFAKPRNDLLIGITAGLTMPFLSWLAVCTGRALKREETRLRLIIILIAAVVMMLPNLLTTVGEMHAYLLILFAALIIGVFLKYEFCSGKKMIAVVCATALLSSAIVGIHKWTCLYERGQKTGVVNDAIAAAYVGEEAPDNVLIIKVCDEEKGYSIFVQPVAFSSYYGYSARDLWNWRHPVAMKDIAISSLASKDEAIAGALAEDDSYDAIWVVRSNGNCEIIKRR